MGARTARTVKRAIAFVAIAIVVVYASVFAWAVGQVRGGRSPGTWTRADVAIVLGAAVGEDGRAGPALTRRSRRALALLQSRSVDWLITTGGVGRHGRSEGDVARSLLIEIDPSIATRIRVENTSTTTYENLTRARPLLRELGARRAWLVSDGYHLARALRMARDLGIDAQGVAADTSPGDRTYGAPRHLAREAALLALYVLTPEGMRRRAEK